MIKISAQLSKSPCIKILSGGLKGNKKKKRMMKKNAIDNVLVRNGRK
jgi:hypothetical protein